MKNYLLLFFFAAFFLVAVFLRAVFFFGTFAPASLASDKPIAIACLRLVTFFPLRPLLSVPLFFSCMAFSTLSCAFFEYFAIIYCFRLVIQTICHYRKENKNKHGNAHLLHVLYSLFP